MSVLRIDIYLKCKSLFALRLSPDDDNTDSREQSQNDNGNHHTWMSDKQLWQTVSQDDAQCSDENRCRQKIRATYLDKC